MKNIKKFMSFFLVLLMTIASLANTGFEIKASTNNQAIVYYYNANWSKANIHYQVGNGSWTSVPGVAMESNSDQSGYRWKYVIDLGSASKATVCFNDGNGNWDSRNSSNYTVYAGSYGVKNETVTELAEFKTTISADQTSVNVGTTVNLTGKVYNENGHRYNSHYFTVKNLDNNTEETRHYAQSEGDYVYSLAWAPTEAGNYEVSFYAQEYSARTAKSSVKVTVKENEFKTTISADQTSVELGTTVNLTGKVYNENGHRYNDHYFTVKNLDANTEETRHYAQSEGSYEYSLAWTPTQAGNYEVSFYAQEYSARTAKSSVKVTVTEPEFKTTISADKTSVNVGTTINLSGQVYNEKGHRYNSHSFKVKNVDTNEMVESYLYASPNGSYGYTSSWTPSEAGNYEISFYANEYCGRTAYSSVKVTVKDVTQNVAKIYYKNSSWSQANIHYQVGNGSWTEVPGVKMQASDNSNYTWMYTIDLGNASSANICFNNGNGSWDSRNSANYPVGKGTYVVTNGSVSKIAN